MPQYQLPALDVKPPAPGKSALDMYKGMLGMQAMSQEVEKNQMALNDQKIFRQAFLDSIDPKTGKPDDDKTIMLAAQRKASPQGIQQYQLHIADLKQKNVNLGKAQDEHAKLTIDLMGQTAKAVLDAPEDKRQDVYQKGVQTLINNKVVPPGMLDPNQIPDEDTLKFYAASAMSAKDQYEEGRKSREAEIKQPGEEAEAMHKQRQVAATDLASAKTQEQYQRKWGKLPAAVAAGFPDPSAWTANSKQDILRAGMSPKEIVDVPIANQAAQAWLNDPANVKPDGSAPTMWDFLQKEKTIPQQFSMSGGGLIPPDNGKPPLPITPSAPNPSLPAPAVSTPASASLEQPIASVRTGQPLPEPSIPTPPSVTTPDKPMAPEDVAKFGLTKIGTNPDGTPIYGGSKDPEEEFKRQQSVLDQVPPRIRDQVKSIINYQDKIPPLGRNNPISQALDYWVKRVDPSYDVKNFVARNKMMLDYNNHSSGTGKQLDAVNTVGGHLSTVMTAIDYLDNGSLKQMNRLANFVGVQTGDDKKKVFEAIVHRIGPEITQAYISAGGSAGERGSNEADWDPSLGPKALKNVTAITAQLLESKIESVAQGWQTTMGRNDFYQRFLTPRARQAFDKLIPESPIQTDFDKQKAEEKAGKPTVPTTKPPLTKEEKEKRDRDLGVIYK